MDIINLIARLKRTLKQKQNSLLSQYMLVEIDQIFQHTGQPPSLR